MHQKFPFEARRGVQAKEKFGRPNWCLLAIESPKGLDIVYMWEPGSEPKKSGSQKTKKCEGKGEKRKERGRRRKKRR